MRASALVLVGMALALSIGLSACRSIAGPSDPQTQRGSVSLEGQQVEREGATVIYVTVPSCHGDPEVVDLEERPDRVLVEVVTTQVLSGDRMDCLDGVSIELERPLGDREVIDAVSGSSLDVARELHLECFDADYPNDPTFVTPEEAFIDGLDSEATEIDAPADPGAYARRDRGMGSVEFEVREGEEQYLIWGITQDADGGWGMTSLGGCWPTGP
jgi:hypothetical protein